MQKEKTKIFSDSESTRALKFANDLWSKIIDDELFSRQKNDICDYVLYLFNKYDSAHFLDSLSNAENERLLKTTASKIKASKKNIAIKFMNEIEYDNILSAFLGKFANDLSQDKVNIKGDKFHFTLENRALRDILDAKLKETMQEGLDYNLNSEKVYISFHSFISMLEIIAPEFKERLAKIKLKYKLKKGVETISAIAGFSADVSGIVELVSKIKR